ncbi:unnamed protein product [Angiostrongylus costaricensis]|uniref:PDE4_UCR domain-containing protein n=1 Tax=Angiostrongylus costaricensis TaxID=334426 RepID=A0A0R3PF16_ANGCS|nr:unnamed protein product [Angiostrongylus costaricensis]
MDNQHLAHCRSVVEVLTKIEISEADAIPIDIDSERRANGYQPNSTNIHETFANAPLSMDVRGIVESSLHMPQNLSHLSIFYTSMKLKFWKQNNGDVDWKSSTIENESSTKYRGRHISRIQGLSRVFSE